MFDVSHLKKKCKEWIMDFLVGVFICALAGTNFIQIAYSLELDERNQALAVRHDHK